MSQSLLLTRLTFPFYSLTTMSYIIDGEGSRFTDEDFKVVDVTAEELLDIRDQHFLCETHKYGDNLASRMKEAAKKQETSVVINNMEEITAWEYIAMFQRLQKAGYFKGIRVEGRVLHWDKNENDNHSEEMKSLAETPKDRLRVSDSESMYANLRTGDVIQKYYEDSNPRWYTGVVDRTKHEFVVRFEDGERWTVTQRSWMDAVEDQRISVLRCRLNES